MLGGECLAEARQLSLGVTEEQEGEGAVEDRREMEEEEEEEVEERSVTLGVVDVGKNVVGGVERSNIVLLERRRKGGMACAT